MLCFCVSYERHFQLFLYEEKEKKERKTRNKKYYQIDLTFRSIKQQETNTNKVLAD